VEKIMPVKNVKIKKSTDTIIENAIARQSSWMDKKRKLARDFFRKFNIFSAKTNEINMIKKIKKNNFERKQTNGLLSYWFPILCGVSVLFIILWVIFIRTGVNEKIILIPKVPEPVTQSVSDISENLAITPSFDIVRIEKAGNIIIAGRYFPNKSVSIIMNKQVVSTQVTDKNGEFVYAPIHQFKPGNYTISLIDSASGIKSENQVFIYISEHGAENSVSLLMTKSGSTILQSPNLIDGDLSVSKIDYLETGRLVVTGDALPRLRVSLSLNGKYLGYAHVTDYKHFGLGADIEKLQPGNSYELSVRLHDGDGNTISEVVHKFVMPIMTGNENTFYTVRRGDCLWIIARNFLSKGVLFSIISEKNNIKNPNLIFPKQVLKIPLKVQ
jgi:nucleoid-associated protein YgaU